MKNTRRLISLLGLCLASLCGSAVCQHFTSGAWDAASTLQQQQQQQPFILGQTQQRQPISADLHNQVSALSSQIAAASRQLESLQQQLALVDQQQQQQQRPQFFSAPQPEAGQAPQQQQQPTTLVEPNEQLELARPPARMFYPARRLPAGTAALPPQRNELEQPLNAPLLQQEPTQQPPSNNPPQQELPPMQFPEQSQPQPGPHNPPRNDDKFAIGLGVLSPGYTQKFGNTALDFNQDKNGFSFTLSNNGHSNQPQQVSKPAGSSS